MAVRPRLLPGHLSLALLPPHCVASGKALPSLVMTHILDTNISMGGPGVEGQVGVFFWALGLQAIASQRVRKRLAGHYALAHIF